MDYVIKINWIKQEVTSIGCSSREESIAFMAEMENTLLTVADSTNHDDEGATFGVSSRRQGDHTIGLRVTEGSDLVLSYALAGVV